MNKPYVKQFDEQGILLNPIVKSYKSNYPNRKQRRTKFNPHANIDGKMVTRVQVEYKGNGKLKFIKHYD